MLTKPSEALEAAKKFLLKPGEQVGEHYKARSICSAVEEAQEKGQISPELQNRTIRYIMLALLPSFTLGHWLARQVNGGWDPLSRAKWIEENLDAIQAHRWAWINRLIAELQEQGK